MGAEPMRDLIIVLPGILGSVLQKQGKDAWAFSAGAILRGLIPGGPTLAELALQKDPQDCDDLGDGVTASALFPDAHLIPGLWKIDGYTRITELIRRTFKVKQGENYFEFPYDWRRDNRVAARRLALLSGQWLSAWRTSSGNPQARLILVCHSMGGLISRYFLEVLNGWVDTRALITFGTPYRGSLNALNMLANGFSKKLGPISLVDMSEFLRSLTSVYQLLPIYPCYDEGDGSLVRLADAKKLPPGLNRDKVKDALDFHHCIADAVSKHQADPAYRENGYRIFPIVGTHQQTLQAAQRAQDGKVQLLAEYEGRDLDGDGTVPRVSATPIELSMDAREFFAAQKHGSLQNADVCSIQLEGVLKTTQLNLTIFRAPPPTTFENRLRLMIEDSYEKGEPVRIRVRPEARTDFLGASIEEVNGTGRWRLPLEPSMLGQLEGVVAELPRGTYRVTVSGKRPVVPVSDLFVVT